MYALNNETADIQIVLQQVASGFKERAASISQGDQYAVSRLLAQAKTKLSELQVTVEELARVCRNTTNFPYQAYTWRLKKAKTKRVARRYTWHKMPSQRGNRCFQLVRMTLHLPATYVVPYHIC